MTTADMPRRAHGETTPAAVSAQDRVAPLPPGEAMAPAKAPVGLGAAPLVAQLLALGLIALGVVAVRDALVSAGIISGTSWLLAAVESVDGMRLQTWMVAVAVAAVIVGLILLVVAIKPRPRKAVALRSSTGVFLRTGDVARIAKEAISDVDGVLTSTVRASRTTITVNAAITAAPSEADGIKSAVQNAVTTALAGLERTPRIKITTTSELGG